MDVLCSAQLVLETEAPAKNRLPDGQIEITHETHWAIHWPFLTDSVDWTITEEQVAGAFTSFARTDPSPDVEAKRNETVAFMRRANADAAATWKRRYDRPPT